MKKKSEYKTLAENLHGLEAVPQNLAEDTDTAGLKLFMEDIRSDPDQEWVDGDVFFGVK